MSGEIFIFWLRSSQKNLGPEPERAFIQKENLMKSDRFLTYILIGIGVLVVAALALFFLRQGGQEYAADTTPEGVTHNFILAMLRSDYDRAYPYLSDSATKPTLDQFKVSFLASRSNYTDVSVQVGGAVITGTTAMVNVTLIFSSGNLFNGASRQPQTAQLTLQNGSWKVVTMPYPFWDYNWGQPISPEGKVPAQPAPTLAPASPTPAFTATP